MKLHPGFSRQKAALTSKLDLNLRNELVKCYIWNVASYGAENWTLRKVDQKFDAQVTVHRDKFL